MNNNNELTNEHIEKVIQNLPTSVIDLLSDENVYLAGGSILSILMDDKVNDFDFFGPSADELRKIAKKQTNKFGTTKFETKNAITVKTPFQKNEDYLSHEYGEFQKQPPFQFIIRWLFNSPFDCMNSFDFTICRLCIWYDKEEKVFKSVIDPRFYADFNDKKLRYTYPIRDEDPSGSLLRTYKYVQKGFKIPNETVCGCVSRFMGSFPRDSNVWDCSEYELACAFDDKISEQYRINLRRENY